MVLCGGLDTLKIDKSQLIVVFHVSIWGGLELCLWGLSPPVATGLDETLAQPCIFAVLNRADVALSVFYSPVLTRCRIFLQS